MTTNTVILVFIAIILLLWWLPALLLTLKINQITGISPAFKKKIIIPMWTVPLVGNVVCCFLLAKTGKLEKLSQSEHLNAASTLLRARR